MERAQPPIAYIYMKKEKNTNLEQHWTAALIVAHCVILHLILQGPRAIASHSFWQKALPLS